MCVIIHKPIGIQISENTLEKCWGANPNGAGMMYSTDNKINIIKGLMTFETFLKEYNTVKDIKTDIILHFRYASCGEITKEQTHPFLVNDNLAFVHNGHLNVEDLIETDEEELLSDTILLNDKILKNLSIDFLNNRAIIYLLREFVKNSILVFMDNFGKIKMIGDCTNCVMIDGCWYSNDYWCNDNIKIEKSIENLLNGDFLKEDFINVNTLV